MKDQCNDINGLQYASQKKGHLLLVKVVQKDHDLNSVDLPKEGDKVHAWGSWVTNKPKGWHEIYLTWEVVKQ